MTSDLRFEYLVILSNSVDPWLAIFKEFTSYFQNNVMIFLCILKY